MEQNKERHFANNALKRGVKMKKLFLFLIVFALLFLPNVGSAEILVCDVISDPINAIEVSVDGVVLPGVMDASPDGAIIRIYTEGGIDYMVLLDATTMAGYESGRHDIKARVRDQSGWWSDWSSPFDAGKPGTLGNVKILKGN